MDKRILVSGLINIETTLAIDGFPLNYFPVTYAFDKVHSTVSGVGYNVAKALHTLGNDIDITSLIGQDLNAKLVRADMARIELDDTHILSTLAETPASVIVYGQGGERQIHVDLKTIQDTAYDVALFEQQLEGCELAVMCNINYNRALLPLAKKHKVSLATDVHVLADPDDEYNRDFMAAADILFLSDEGLHGRLPESLINELFQRYQNQIIVMGRGSQGALMFVAEDQQFYHANALQTRPIVSTIGAGDALFSAFIHTWLATGNPYVSIQTAVRFASWKIGEKGAAEGFLSASELETLIKQHPF
ncbi:carbohydrate kinase family protein [Corallincola platygyrae]|uniref:Carbohydrate kinase family protein n=1 Tax=Corallincola platygyrae TaxID=1193278 RepID=A0ABW4XQ83_9GAMM